MLRGRHYRVLQSKEVGMRRGHIQESPRNICRRRRGAQAYVPLGVDDGKLRRKFSSLLLSAEQSLKIHIFHS